jgi:probable HAF family extracellular repeat protein
MPKNEGETLMRNQLCIWLTTVLLVAGISSSPELGAQQTMSDHHHARHQKYKLIDLGTLGGPASYLANGADGILNNQGILSGWANTATPDPFPAACASPNCFVTHAFETRNGMLNDLGTLPHGASSQAFWTTSNGLIAGFSQNGDVDPLVPGFPELRAVLWKHGSIVDLGTLPGGHESVAAAVNSRGEVSGFALNDIPDNYSLVGLGTQTRAFLWKPGTGMKDLGTLGGPDAFAAFINENGQVAGYSYTNATPNAVTGIPTQNPFLWQNGVMRDLGSLGGTNGTVTGLNNSGAVIGQSNLAGDLFFHPFVWTSKNGMRDLGTLGGHTGVTNWINDAGEVAGKADLPGPDPQLHDAVLWEHGKVIDLGTLPGDVCGNAYFVNSRGQVVGTSEDKTLCAIPAGQHAFLWEHGGPMIDLNLLIPPRSGLLLTYAVAINDHGEIAGFGVPPGCKPEDYESCGHAYILEPDGDCDEATEARIAGSQK